MSEFTPTELQRYRWAVIGETSAIVRGRCETREEAQSLANTLPGTATVIEAPFLLGAK